MGMDHYKIIKQLGGTTGTFLAVDKQDGAKRVVIKRLVDGTQGMQELNVSLRVRHPNIIPFLESFVHDGALYVVLAYAEGGDLDAYLKRLVREKRQLPIMALLRGFKQLIEALQCCHNQNIMHRDVKPGNVFLNSEVTELYLGDFGSAKALLHPLSLTSTFVGSPIWISPELLTGMQYSYPSDIWSLGCVFYEMATLRQPFSSSSFATLVQQITSGDIAPLPSNLPEDIRGIIMSMLQVDPSRRCNLARALEMTMRAIAARTPALVKVAERPAADAMFLSPPPQHLPRRALDAAVKTQQVQVPQKQQRLSPMGETAHEEEEEEEEAMLSVWLHAREHDVNIIERYLKKFRQSDELVLATDVPSPSVSSENAQCGNKLEIEERREKEQCVQPVSPSPQAAKSSVVQRVEARMKHRIVKEVRVESTQRSGNDSSSNNNNHHHCHRKAKQESPPKQDVSVSCSRRCVIKGCVQTKRKKDACTAVKEVVSPFDCEPFLRLGPNGSGHTSAGFRRVKSTPIVSCCNPPESPHGDGERQLSREKREQERAKMLRMIREQKAKAMQERKSKGKLVARDAVAVEIVLPDNVRYVEV